MPPPPTPGNDFVRFSTDWKIDWSDSMPLEKRLNTSFDNVVLHWRAKLSGFNGRMPHFPDGVQFSLNYISGSWEKFENMEYSIAVVKQDRSTEILDPGKPYEAVRLESWDGMIFEERIAKNIQTKFGLSDIGLVLRITLKIPISAFTFVNQQLPVTTPPQWLIDVHNVINDPQKSTCWNAKLISRDKTVFYCHKIIGFQSKRLEIMFRQQRVIGKPENEYEFPELATDSMRAFVKYLYTGQAMLGDLSIDHLIELVYATEHYNLQSLKQACIFEMWQKVVKHPSVCYRIIQLNDSHDDMISLKCRAMDALVENYEKLEAHKKNLVDEFGGGEAGQIMCRRFALFQSRRLQAFFG